MPDVHEMLKKTVLYLLNEVRFLWCFGEWAEIQGQLDHLASVGINAPHWPLLHLLANHLLWLA